jgi:hypothetical protein
MRWLLSDLQARKSSYPASLTLYPTVSGNSSVVLDVRNAVFEGDILIYVQQLIPTAKSAGFFSCRLANSNITVLEINTGIGPPNGVNFDLAVSDSWAKTLRVSNGMLRNTSIDVSRSTLGYVQLSNIILEGGAIRFAHNLVNGSINPSTYANGILSVGVATRNGSTVEYVNNTIVGMSSRQSAFAFSLSADLRDFTASTLRVTNNTMAAALNVGDCPTFLYFDMMDLVNATMIVTGNALSCGYGDDAVMLYWRSRIRASSVVLNFTNSSFGAIQMQEVNPTELGKLTVGTMLTLDLTNVRTTDVSIAAAQLGAITMRTVSISDSYVGKGIYLANLNCTPTSLAQVTYTRVTNSSIGYAVLTTLQMVQWYVSFRGVVFRGRQPADALFTIASVDLTRSVVDLVDCYLSSSASQGIVIGAGNVIKDTFITVVNPYVNRSDSGTSLASVVTFASGIPLSGCTVTIVTDQSYLPRRPAWGPLMLGDADIFFLVRSELRRTSISVDVRGNGTSGARLGDIVWQPNAPASFVVGQDSPATFLLSVVSARINLVQLTLPQWISAQPAFQVRGLIIQSSSVGRVDVSATTVSGDVAVSDCDLGVAILASLRIVAGSVFLSSNRFVSAETNIVSAQTLEFAGGNFTVSGNRLQSGIDSATAVSLTLLQMNGGGLCVTNNVIDSTGSLQRVQAAITISYSGTRWVANHFLTVAENDVRATVVGSVFQLSLLTAVNLTAHLIFSEVKAMTRQGDNTISIDILGPVSGFDTSYVVIGLQLLTGAAEMSVNVKQIARASLQVTACNLSTLVLGSGSDAIGPYAAMPNVVVEDSILTTLRCNVCGMVSSQFIVRRNTMTNIVFSQIDTRNQSSVVVHGNTFRSAGTGITAIALDSIRTIANSTVSIANNSMRLARLAGASSKGFGLQLSGSVVASNIFIANNTFDEDNAIRVAPNPCSNITLVVDQPGSSMKYAGVHVDVQPSDDGRSSFITTSFRDQQFGLVSITCNGKCDNAFLSHVSVRNTRVRPLIAFGTAVEVTGFTRVAGAIYVQNVSIVNGTIGISTMGSPGNNWTLTMANTSLSMAKVDRFDGTFTVALLDCDIVPAAGQIGFQYTSHLSSSNGTFVARGTRAFANRAVAMAVALQPNTVVELSECDMEVLAAATTVAQFNSEGNDKLAATVSIVDSTFATRVEIGPTLGLTLISNVLLASARFMNTNGSALPAAATASPRPARCNTDGITSTDQSAALIDAGLAPTTGPGSCTDFTLPSTDAALRNTQTLETVTLPTLASTMNMFADSINAASDVFAEDLSALANEPPPCGDRAPLAPPTIPPMVRTFTLTKGVGAALVKSAVHSVSAERSEPYSSRSVSRAYPSSPPPPTTSHAATPPGDITTPGTSRPLTARGTDTHPRSVERRPHTGAAGDIQSRAGLSQGRSLRTSPCQCRPLRRRRLRIPAQRSETPFKSQPPAPLLWPQQPSAVAALRRRCKGSCCCP